MPLYPYPARTGWDAGTASASNQRMVRAPVSNVSPAHSGPPPPNDPKYGNDDCRILGGTQISYHHSRDATFLRERIAKREVDMLQVTR